MALRVCFLVTAANQLLSARNMGFTFPSTLIANNPNVASEFYNKCDGNMVAKALHHHDVKTNGKVYSVYTCPKS